MHIYWLHTASTKKFAFNNFLTGFTLKWKLVGLWVFSRFELSHKTHIKNILRPEDKWPYHQLLRFLHSVARLPDLWRWDFPEEMPWKPYELQTTTLMWPPTSCCSTEGPARS
jgi:hypothetical protein